MATKKKTTPKKATVNKNTPVTVSANDFYKMWAEEADMTQAQIETAAKALAPALSRGLQMSGLQTIAVSEAFMIQERLRSGEVPEVDENGEPTGEMKPYKDVPTVSVRLGINVTKALKAKASKSTSTKKLLGEFGEDDEIFDEIVNGGIISDNQEDLEDEAA